jgi:hypothetical protein
MGACVAGEQNRITLRKPSLLSAWESSQRQAQPIEEFLCVGQGQFLEVGEHVDEHHSAFRNG